MKQNHHFVPQFYLEGFTEAPGSKKIWLHDLEKQESRRTQIKSIANENNFYPEEIETFFATKIEGPVKKIIQLIASQRSVSQFDKYLLATYLDIQRKRVPAHKVYMNQMAPSIFEDEKEKIDTELLELSRIDPEHKGQYFGWKKTIDEKIQDNEEREKILQKVWVNSLNPQDTTNIINQIRSMTWSYLVSSTATLLTNDNPFYFSQEIGIMKENSEILFPLTSTIALWITNRSELKEGAYYKATPKGIDIINLRTILNAYKYVYSFKQSDWIYYLRKLHRPEGETK